MAYPEDPKGFRRGQPTGAHFPPEDRRGGELRQPARQEQRNGAGQGGGKQQAAFSAYRPEAYANNSKGGGRPADRAEWQQQQSARSEPPRPAPEPYRPAPPPVADRGRPAHDPYYNAASDPYDTGTRDFDANWRSTDYQEQPAEQFASANYYPHEEPNHADAQSTHDRFFAAEPEPERAVAPPPAPAAGRYRQPQSNFDEDFHEEPRPAPRAAKPAAASTGRGFDEAGDDHRWDNFDQQPAPESIRPFPNAKLDNGDEDLDADYFDDEYEGEEDFVEQKKGGKKLMAAVLVGAVVTGGGLAYLYKSQLGGADSGEPPIMTADSRPIKETPTDPGGRDFPNGSKLIYDRLDNGGAGPDGPTRVAAREEQSSGNDVQGVVTTGGSGTLEERIQNALRDAKKQDDPQATAANSVSSFDTPRPVRTEVFRPDGSVDQSRIQRRQAPAENDARVANAPRGVVSREAPPAPAPSLAAAPTPAPARAQIAAATPAPALVTTAPSGAGGDAGMFVQIAARNDQAAAMAAFADLQQKYAAVLGNHSPSVRKVDLGEKGVWYRLMVGPMGNKADADKLCEDLKTAGMKSCFSRKE